MSFRDTSDLPAAAANLKHRVSVEVAARSSETVRTAILEREDTLLAASSEIASEGSVAGVIRKSVRNALTSMRGSLREESGQQLTEVMIENPGSGKTSKFHQFAPKQNAEEVEKEINVLRAAKKVAAIEIHKSSLQETETSLRTDLSKGLTSAEAAARLLRNGPNKLTPPKVMPWWLKLLLHFVDGFQIVLIMCAALSIIAGFISEPIDQPSVNLGYVLIFVVFASSTFAYSQEAKSDKVMEGFNALTPARCRVVRDGNTIDCAAEDLVIGDVVEVQFGEKVPADLRIIQTSNLKVCMCSPPSRRMFL